VENGATPYSGGRVLVLDGVTPPQEVLVVRDGRVAGVGDAGGMTRLAGQGARCVSVRGATIMPGLIDTHPHLLHFGRSRSRSSTCPTPVTQHAYLVTEVQARRYAALGFRVTTSMSFSWGKGDLFAERIGKHVWPNLIPVQRLLRSRCQRPRPESMSFSWTVSEVGTVARRRSRDPACRYLGLAGDGGPPADLADL